MIHFSLIYNLPFFAWPLVLLCSSSPAFFLSTLDRKYLTNSSSFWLGQLEHILFRHITIFLMSLFVQQQLVFTNQSSLLIQQVFASRFVNLKIYFLGSPNYIFKSRVMINNINTIVYNMRDWNGKVIEIFMPFLNPIMIHFLLKFTISKFPMECPSIKFNDI